jgi:hypothetical protein
MLSLDNPFTWSAICVAVVLALLALNKLRPPDHGVPA